MMLLLIKGMKGECNNEKRSTTFWKIPERNGNAEYRSIHRMGIYHGTFY